MRIILTICAIIAVLASGGIIQASTIEYTVFGWGPSHFPGPITPPEGSPWGPNGYPGDTVELASYTGTLDLTAGTYNLKINTLNWTIDYTYGGTETEWDYPAHWSDLSFNVTTACSMSVGTATGSLSQPGLLEITWFNDYLSFNSGSTTSFAVQGYRVDVTPLGFSRQAGTNFDGGNPWVQPSRDVIATFVVTPMPQCTISGKVTSGGVGIDDVVMNGLPGNPVTGSGGLYSATVDYGWSGTVIPTKAGYTFGPAQRIYTNVAEDQNSDDYSATLNTYTISGYIKNLCDVPIGCVVVNANNGGGSGTTDANGYYEVRVSYNWSGTLTPNKALYTFEPNCIEYTNVLEHKTDQNYEATNIYDLDCNGSIGYGDVKVMSENWLMTGTDVPGDLYKDSNHIVNFKDFAEFALVWGTEECR
jgi:hypothetical protein